MEESDYTDKAKRDSEYIKILEETISAQQNKITELEESIDKIKNPYDDESLNNGKLQVNGNTCVGHVSGYVVAPSYGDIPSYNGSGISAQSFPSEKDEKFKRLKDRLQ